MDYTGNKRIYGCRTALISPFGVLADIMDILRGFINYIRNIR